CCRAPAPCFSSLPRATWPFESDRKVPHVLLPEVRVALDHIERLVSEKFHQLKRGPPGHRAPGRSGVTKIVKTNINELGGGAQTRPLARRDPTFEQLGHGLRVAVTREQLALRAADLPQ